MNHKHMRDMEFTGEFYLPGKTPERIEVDHMERYRFACNYVKDCSVLDIACGAGYAGPMLIEAGARHYHGVDINADLVEYATATYVLPNISYSVGDICDYLHNTQYDLVISFETIEHISNYKRALANLARLCKLGGTLLISSPNRLITSPQAQHLNDKPANKYHTQEFIPDELLSELNAASFACGRQDVFGQRQRWQFQSQLANRLRDRLLRASDASASPKVAPVRNKTPRYFVIRATRQQA